MWPRLLLVAALAALSACSAVAEEAGRRVLEVRPPAEPALRVQHGDDLGFSAADDAAGARVKRMWGVSDATATAGKLFVHSIDKHAFDGPVKQLEVFGASVDSAPPAWLTFDPARRTFSGVPLHAELGAHLVTVRASAGFGSSAGAAKDRFMIDVVHEPEADIAEAAAGDAVVCGDTSATTVAAVYFDVAPLSLDGAARLRLLRAVAEVARVPAETPHMTSHVGAVPLGDEHVLEAGPGAGERTSSRLTVVSWKVGCAEEVRADRRAGVAALQQDRRLSALSRAAGRAAAAWILYRREPAGRTRRQVEPDDGSGDYYDDDEYVDYDGSFDEWNNGDYEYGWTEVPTRHVVPQLGTPAGPAPPPATPVYPPARVSAAPDRSRVTTVLPTPVAPTRYLPDAGLQPSGGGGGGGAWDGRPSPASRRPTTDLESSMRPPGPPPEATVRWPDGVQATPTVPDGRVLETAGVGSSNYKPHVQRRMRKVLVIAGKELRHRIPEDTFQDQESGGTRQLHLMLRKASGAPLLNSDWIQFDAVNQEIYGLPLEEHIGEYRLLLTAQDEQGGSVTEPVDVVVRQYRMWRAANHRFHLQFRLLKPRQFPVTVDWELELLRRLAAIQGQAGAGGGLLVYELRAVQDQPVRLVWIDDSLSTHSCDTPQLSALAARLLGKDGAASAELRKLLAPEFAAVSLRLELLNVCQDETLTELPAWTATAGPEPNQPPVRRKPIDLITARVGRLLKLQVPEDTFFDMEDIDVRGMQLQLLTSERQPLPAGSWLRFEPRNQEFIGLPLDADVGRRHYHLECIDSGGLKVLDSIEVVVAARDATAPDPTVQFSVTLDDDFAAFSADPLQKARLMQKLARLLGDADTDAMLVHHIRAGSVVFSWFNASLPTSRCADAEIAALRRRLVDDRQTVTAAAVQALAPFRLTAAEVTPRGLCLADRAPSGAPPAAGADAAPQPDESAPEGRGDEYLVTFIIPAVVIAAMLLVAGVIACVLLRARRRGKMQMTDNGTYVSRGIPVIFSDELEDRVEKNAKTPVILTNEQPPQPPTYPADGASSPATPMLNGRGEPTDDGADAPYQRPPPFAGADEARAGGRAAAPVAKPVTNYRQPPPYVPP